MRQHRTTCEASAFATSIKVISTDHHSKTLELIDERYGLSSDLALDVKDTTEAPVAGCDEIVLTLGNAGTVAMAYPRNESSRQQGTSKDSILKMRRARTVPKSDKRVLTTEMTNWPVHGAPDSPQQLYLPPGSKECRILNTEYESVSIRTEVSRTKRGLRVHCGNEDTSGWTENLRQDPSKWCTYVQ